MKMKTPNLKSLWERAGKAQKTTCTSTPNPQLVESQDQNNSSPIELQLHVYTSGAPSIEHHDEDPSTDPEICSPLSPVTGDHESSDESDDEAIYDIDLLQHDPGKRRPIADYDVNEQDAVRRGYIALGPSQPREHDFPGRRISGNMRRFKAHWFDDFNWLEYSVEQDAILCFVCYLFKDKKSAGGDNFVNGGFDNWNLTKRYQKHVGGISSAHNVAQEKYNLFITPKASIREIFSSISIEEKVKYKCRLTWSLKCLRFILHQGLACRGHDESEDSVNKGNFLELLNWLAANFDEVNKVVLKNAPKNCQMICPKIQKYLINSCAKETTSLIMEDLGDEYFAILADESSDVYHNEQLALCIRYVDKKGRVVERFIGIIHVGNTAALTLKTAIQSILMDHSLSFSRVRGQGYDGASNMKGHVNGLKKLIMDESPSAYYVHCFAHQLQLTLVAVAKENADCISFFEQLRFLLSVIGISCKKTQMLRVAQAQ